jgi:hypothetical protein
VGEPAKPMWEHRHAAFGVTSFPASVTSLMPQLVS